MPPRSKNPRTLSLCSIPSRLLRPPNPSASNVIFSSPSQSSISIGLFHESIIDLQQTLRHSHFLPSEAAPPASMNGVYLHNPVQFRPQLSYSIEGLTSNLERATHRQWHAKSASASAAQRTIAGSTTAYLTHAHARACLQGPFGRSQTTQCTTKRVIIRSQPIQRIVVCHSSDWNGEQELL